MYINLNKFFFMHRNIEYLGPMIDPGELKVSKKTITESQELSLTKPKTDIKSFLRMRNVHWCFVKDLGTISAPLNFVLRKDEPDEFELRKEQIYGFDILPENLSHQYYPFRIRNFRRLSKQTPTTFK